MHQMGGIGDGYEGNHRSIKGTATLSGSRLSLLLTGFVLFLSIFVMVIVFATRLSEQLVNFGSGDFHVLSVYMARGFFIGFLLFVILTNN
jgi:hypothetical protein